MVSGSPPGESTAAEKARYRRKLADWRAMGFDVSALEVLLETDFEKFKEKRFELMRSQIGVAWTAPAASETMSQPSSSPPLPSSDIPPPDFQAAPAAARRPGLHSHFAGMPRQAEAPASRPDAAASHERIHSEMRYPAARRRTPAGDARTFSVGVESRPRPRSISAGAEALHRPDSRHPIEKRGAKAPAPPAPIVARRRRPEPAREELERFAVEEQTDEPPADEATGAEVATGGESGPAEEAEPDGEVPVEEEEPAGEQEGAPGEDGASEAGPDGQHSRRPSGHRDDRPVVRKKLRKVAVRPRPPEERRLPRGAIAVAVVIALVVAGLAGYPYLWPHTTVTPRAVFPAAAVAGELVFFDASKSTSSGQGISRYEWKFGDNGSRAGKNVSYVYLEPRVYTVSLTVEDQDGTRSAAYRSTIAVSPLSVTVPARRLNDRAAYAVTGSADVKNTDTFLYKVGIGGQQITVSELQLNFSGNQTQWVLDQDTRKDGFSQNHSAVQTTTAESLRLDGRAYTSIYPVQLGGELNYNEDSFADAASGGVFQVQSRAVTKLSLYNMPTGPGSLNSTDTLRAYPAVPGVTAQFQPEDIYRGRTFSQSDAQPDGSLRSGNVTYYWTRIGLQNIAGFPSLGLNITAGSEYLDQNGFTEFFLNVWLSGRCAAPTTTLAHVAGRSGDTQYRTDHLAVMTSFTAGSGTVDETPQAFDSSPLPTGLYYSPFSDVVESGPGNASLRFTPEQALQEARARDGSFRDFLGQNPQAYAVASDYSEGQLGPGSSFWNLTFSSPGAPTSYWVNVTRDILQQYAVRGAFGGAVSQLRTPESSFSRMLSLTSASGRMQNDTETAGVFFKNGAVNWASGVSMGIDADPVYPGINLATLFASPERAGYAAHLRNSKDTAAFSLDTGQMMYFYTHTSY